MAKIGMVFAVLLSCASLQGGPKAFAQSTNEAEGLSGTENALSLQEKCIDSADDPSGFRAWLEAQHFQRSDRTQTKLFLMGHTGLVYLAPGEAVASVDGAGCNVFFARADARALLLALEAWIRSSFVVTSEKADAVRPDGTRFFSYELEANGKHYRVVVNTAPPGSVAEFILVAYAFKLQ